MSLEKKFINKMFSGVVNLNSETSLKPDLLFEILCYLFLLLSTIYLGFLKMHFLWVRLAALNNLAS